MTHAQPMSERLGNDIAELTICEVNQVDGGLLFLLFNPLTAGVAVGAGIYLTTEYLT